MTKIVAVGFWHCFYAGEIISPVYVLIALAVTISVQYRAAVDYSRAKIDDLVTSYTKQSFLSAIALCAMSFGLGNAIAVNQKNGDES